MGDTLFSTLLGHKKKIVLIFALITAGAAPFLLKVHKDFSVERYYLSTSETRKNFGAFKTLFRRQDELVYLFFKDPNFNWSSHQDMRAIEEGFRKLKLVDVAWFGNMIPDLKFDTEASFDAKKIRSADPFFDGVYWNTKRTTFILSGYLDTKTFKNSQLAALDSDLKKLIKPYAREGRTLKLSGTPIITVRYMQFMQRDQMIFMGISFALLLLLMWVLMGSIKGLLLFLLSVVPAWVAIFAVMGLMGSPVTALLMVLPIILLIVGISDSIHILTPLKRMKEKGEKDVASVFATMWLPCLLTSLTTALGFLSLILTRIPAVVSFGAFTAAGIMLTWVSTMLLFPVLLAWFPVTKQTALERLIERFAQALPGFTRRFRFVILGVTVAAVALLAVLYRGLPVDTYMVDDIKKTNPIAQTIQWIGAEGFGVFKLNLILKPEKSLGDPKMVKWMTDFKDWMVKNPHVKNVVSPHDIMAQVNKRLPFGLSDWEPFFKTDLGKKVFASVYNIEKRTGQIIIFMHDAGTVKTTAVIDAINKRLKELPPPAQAHLTGATIVAQNSFNAVVKGFSRSLLYAILVIFLILIIVSRSPVTAIAMLLPNIIPLGIILGVMGAFSMRITPSLALVFAIALGLIVDNSIHLFGALLRYTKEGDSLRRAMERAVTTTGAAITLTTIVISAGFSGMIFSGYMAIHNMGLFICAALILSFVANLCIIPALFQLIPAKSAEPPKA